MGDENDLENDGTIGSYTGTFTVNDNNPMMSAAVPEGIEDLMSGLLEPLSGPETGQEQLSSLSLLLPDPETEPLRMTFVGDVHQNMPDDMTHVKANQDEILRVEGGFLPFASLRLLLTFCNPAFAKEAVQLEGIKVDKEAKADRKFHAMRVDSNPEVVYGVDEDGRYFVDVDVAGNDGTVELGIKFLAFSSDGLGKKKRAGGWRLHCHLFDAPNGRCVGKKDLKMKSVAKPEKKRKPSQSSIDYPKSDHPWWVAYAKSRRDKYQSKRSGLDQEEKEEVYKGWELFGKVVGKSGP